MIILWRVVDHCNLACPFCAFDRRLDKRRHAADPAQVARFIDVLGAWAGLSQRPVLLSWLGGEPLLWKPLEALTRRARRNGIALSITTNGTTLGSPYVRSQLIENYSEVTISVDGLAGFHDRMRGWPGAFDKLAKYVSALAAERKASGSLLRLRANIVLMRGNIRMFPELCHALSSWGMDEISFNQLGGRDRPEFFPDNRLEAADIASLRAVLPLLRMQLAPRTGIVGAPTYLARIENSIAGVALPISDCRVADNFLFVDEAGRIAPCSFTPDHFGLSVDGLSDARDLDRLPGRLRAQQKCRPSADCSDCPSTQQFEKFEVCEAAA